jgi:hypothetical protein
MGHGQVNQGDEAAGFIRRADVAAVCVEAAFSPSALNCTFEVYNADGSAVSTRTLGVAGILSDPKLQQWVRHHGTVFKEYTTLLYHVVFILLTKNAYFRTNVTNF